MRKCNHNITMRLGNPRAAGGKDAARMGDSLMKSKTFQLAANLLLQKLLSRYVPKKAINVGGSQV